MKYTLENSNKIRFDTLIGDNDDPNSNIPNRLTYTYYLVTGSNKFEIPFSVSIDKDDMLSTQIENKIIDNICELTGMNIVDDLFDLPNELLDAVINDYIKKCSILKYRFLRKNIEFNNLDEETNIITTYVGDHVKITQNIDRNIKISCNGFCIIYTDIKDDITILLYNFIDKYNEYLYKNMCDILFTNSNSDNVESRLCDGLFNKTNSCILLNNMSPNDFKNSEFVSSAFKMPSGSYALIPPHTIDNNEDEDVLYN